MYKLKHEDDQSFLIQGKDGKDFKVAKKALPEEFHEKVRKLGVMKMAEGGVVPDAEETQDQQQTPDFSSFGDVNALANSYDPKQDMLNSRIQLLDQTLPQVIPEADVSPGGRQQYLKEKAIDSLYNDKQAQDAAAQKDAEIKAMLQQIDQQKTQDLAKKASVLGLPAALVNQAPPTQIQAATPEQQQQASSDAQQVNVGNQSQPSQQYPQGLGQMGGVPTNLGGIMGEYKKSIDQLSAAQQNQATQEGGLWKDYQDNVNKSFERQQKAFDDFKTSQAKLQQDYMDSKIDQNRIFSNMSTGNKIGAALAVAFSGIGSGLQGGKPNMALDAINNAIDRDIQAQKIDMGKKQNLMTMNMQKYRNVEDAEMATRAQLLGVTQAKIQQIAAQTKSAQALAMAHAAYANLGEKIMDLGVRLSARQADMQSKGIGTDQGGLVPGSPQDYALMNSDKDYAKRRVIVNGRVYQHTGTDKEAEAQRVFESKYQPIISAVSELNKLGPMALVPGSKENNLAQSIRAGLSTSIAGLQSTEIGSSRINNEEAKQALEQIKDPGSLKQFVNGNVRNNSFINHLIDVGESLRKENLMGYKGMFKPTTAKKVGG